MKVLVIGGGGREHAICEKILESPKLTQLFCAPGNAGIGEIATCVPLAATDIDGIVRFAKDENIDFVVVAPDDPLAMGLVDALEGENIAAFGPRANAAIIESSKSFSKQFMQKYNIPTARYRVFDNAQDAMDYIDAQGAPIVVKADGLALGKGVIVAQTADEAKQAVRAMLLEGKFGKSGARVVIEECLTGPEITVLAFCDGTHLVPMPSSQDHKRAFDGDLGPNTGGMGAFSPSPHYTDALAHECMENIFLPTVAGLQAEGRAFQGVIYFGLMLTEGGVKVIEYNARFGDPETQTILPLLESDLLEIFQACRAGKLDQLEIRWSTDASCCVVLASGGYPLAYEKGYPITGIQAAKQLARVYHAGTSKNAKGEPCTAGGRVLGISARGGNLSEAAAQAYKASEHIFFERMHLRRDIGKV